MLDRLRELLDRLREAVLLVVDQPEQPQRGAVRPLGEDVLGELARAAAVAGVEEVLGGANRALAPGSVAGRQRGRALEQLRGGVRGTARPRAGRGVLEQRGDLRVGRPSGEREVAGALLDVVDRLREPRVRARAVLLARGRIDGGGEQRMAEAHLAVGQLDHARLLGPGQPVGDVWECGFHRCDRGARQRGRGEQRLTRAGGQAGEPAGEQRGQRVAHRHGFAGAGAGSRELQRVQRVALRRARDPLQRGPSEREGEAAADHLVQLAGVERAEPQPLDLERMVERERVGRRLAVDADRGDDADRPLPDPAQREGERARRRAVEPLHVIQREDQRRGLGEQRRHRGADRAAVRRRSARALAQQRDVERVALGLGQLGAGDRREQVRERRERELGFGLDRPAGEHRDG